MRRLVDYGPAVALLGTWLLAGLGGALTVAAATGDARHVVLGVVTLPALVLIVRAMRALPRRPVARL